MARRQARIPLIELKRGEAIAPHRREGRPARDRAGGREPERPQARPRHDRVDPDRAARRLAEVLDCGVIITDTFGRPWREGLVDAAIGLARIPPLIDLRGTHDDQGHRLQVTVLAAADALAAAAGLVMGKTQRTPAALIRGFVWEESRSNAAMLLRSRDKDLFL